MNLYAVYPLVDNSWCCYVFAESRNKAKSYMVHNFTNDDEYIDYGCQTILKDVGGEPEVCETDCKRLLDLGVTYRIECD